MSNNLVNMVTDKMIFGGKFFQAVSQKVIKGVLEKTIKDSLGVNSKVVVDRIFMEHTDGQPVKLQLEISADIAEADILALIDKALNK